MEKVTCAVCLDIGGTSAKSGVVGRDGNLLSSTLKVKPVDSSGSAESILESFAASLDSALKTAHEGNLTPAGIGVAICGPFDYENGISKITGLDKYESIYDVNVKEELKRMLDLPDSLPFFFDIDAWAFGRGEVWSGAGRNYDRVIVFTMGTGVGSAFAVNGEIVGEGPGVPWVGWVSGQKHGDGILNDYISRTYMIERYRDLTGKTIEIDLMAGNALSGEVDARLVFEEIGATLGGFLQSHNVPDFKPECIIFGGQISRSSSLFIEPVREALSDFSFLKEIIPADDIECSALKGVAKHVFDRIGL
jgi:glucokinase